MKKTSSAENSSGKNQGASKESLKSVVTRLQASESRDSQVQEPDIDLQQLRAAIDETPEINATKVVALHRRIVNGDYRIDSERLAGKMLELESSLDRD